MPCMHATPDEVVCLECRKLREALRRAGLADGTSVPGATRLIVPPDPPKGAR